MIEKYRTEEMEEIWSETHKFEVWWSIEAAALKGFVELGELDEADYQKILREASWEVEEIRRIEAEINHDLLAFLEAVQSGLGDLAAYVHRGMTSADVKDTAKQIRIVESLKLVQEAITPLEELLEKMARKYKNTVMIGRTHGVHAEPTTFGLRCLNWLTEWRRHQRRLEEMLQRVAVGKISGAVGTYAQIDPRVEEVALEELDLQPAPVSTQILQRDRHAEVLGELANLAGTVEKMALEVRNLQRTEILELEESFGSSQKGSSAMPHKKNPIHAERLCGQARCMRGYAQNGFETQALWHERDLTNSSTERITFPDAFQLIHYMLDQVHDLFDGLQVNESNMRENIDETRGLIYSQRVLVALTEAGWPRKQAYERVQEHAQTCWEQESDFVKAIKNDEKIKEVLGTEKLTECFSPDAFLTHLDTIYERVLG